MRFASMRASILRQHWGWQIPLWIGYAMVWLAYNILLRPLSWMATEASAQAIAGARRALAPLVWPLIIIAMLAVMLLTMGIPRFAQLMGPLLEEGVTFLVIGCVAYIAYRSVWPKRRRRR